MAMSEAEFQRQYAEATRRGEERLERVPGAVAVCYNRRTRKVVIDLDNGCTLLVPPELAQGLTDASPGELADVHVLGPGTTIAWPRLDIQFSVTGLMMGIFGTPAWMAELARRAGRTKSSAKAGAAPRTGARNGAPRIGARHQATEKVRKSRSLPSP